MYRTETHLHVSEISPCGKVKASEMIKLYHEAGYKTVFVTDHFIQSFFDGLGDIPWSDKTTVFFSGFYRAKEAGKQYGMNILMSAEISFEGSHNHYLVYGAEKEFFDAYPNLCKMDAEKFYEAAKKHGVFVVQAHPHRDDVCFPTPECVDAMEIYNSNARHTDYSDKTEKFARDNSLFTTSGSDAHQTVDVGKAGIMSEKEIKTAADYIEVIKSGNFTVIRE